MLARLFDGPADPSTLLLALVPTLVAAWIAARAARSLAGAGLRAMVRDTMSTSSPHVRGPLRIVAATAFILVVGILLFPAFEMAGLRPRTGVHLRTLSAWTFGAGLRIVLLILTDYALGRMTSTLVGRFEREMSVGTDLDALGRGKRARTLGSVIQN